MKSISDETRAAILDATWSLIAKGQRLDVGLAAIAAAAGVSRQTIYLAFGSRAGLLTAMARNKDGQSDHVERLGLLSQLSSPTVAELERYVGVWLDYLPIIYPVAVLLDAAAVTDREAAAAWDDRMKGALRAGLRSMVRRLARRGERVGRAPPQRAADQIWSLIQPSAWRQLVVECGWSVEEFRRSRLELMRATLRPLQPARPGQRRRRPGRRAPP